MSPTQAYRVANAEAVNGGSGPQDPRVLQAVEEYLAALEAGQAPGREEFLARHSAVAAQLGEYLDGLELIHRAGSAAGPLSDDDASGDEPAGAEPLGDFLLLRELGRGGMGVVYEALAALAQSQGCAQGAAVRRGAGRPAVAAVQERGAGGGVPAPPAHRAGLRRRL